MKKFLKSIPKLPLSAFIFYSAVLILRLFGVIPEPIEIIAALEKLLASYGTIIVFFSVLLEGIVYFGLYFPGTTLITISILFSDGSFLSFLFIAIAAALALTLDSTINYLFGRKLSKKFVQNSKTIKKTLSKGLVLSIIHPNSLAFYFFDSGIKKRNPLKILLVPLLAMAYALLVCLIISSFKAYFRVAVESPYLLLIFIFIWLVIAYVYENFWKK